MARFRSKRKQTNYRRKGRKTGYKRNTKYPRGHLRIERRLPEIAYSNGLLPGSASITDPTGTCLNATILGATVGSVAASNLYDIGWSLNFRLDQLINSTDITTIADKYKIKYAKVKIYYNNTDAGVNGLGGMPTVQYVIDNDDKAVLSIGALREKMGMKYRTFKNASSAVSMSLVPKPTRLVYATGVSNAYEIPNKSLWLDCAYPNVEHYGVKGVLSGVYLPANTSATNLFKFDISLVVEAKDFQ